MQNPTRVGNEKEISEICNTIEEKLLPYSSLLLDDIGFSANDLNEIFDTNYHKIEEMNSEVVGLSLFLYCLQKNIVTEGTRASFADCFLEATGIAAGLAVIGDLGGAAIGKKAVKAIAKIAFKSIGKQALGGIGLVLLAGEIVWCMNR